MRMIEHGGLRARVAGGADDEGGGDGPAVVLLHGFGAPGTDLVGLARVLDVPRDVRFVFPEAPLSLPMGLGDARAWWMIDMARLERALQSGNPRVMEHDVPDGLAEVRERVGDLVEAVADELTVPSGKLMLGGFSQGGMLALDVALHRDMPLAGMALMSSTLLARDEWIPRMPTRAGLPVFLSHGTADPLLPYEMAEVLKEELEKAGLVVHWNPFRGGHEVPAPLLGGLATFLQRTLLP